MSTVEIIFYLSLPKWVRPDEAQVLEYKVTAVPLPPPPTAPASLPFQVPKMNPLGQTISMLPAGNSFSSAVFRAIGQNDNNNVHTRRYIYPPVEF